MPARPMLDVCKVVSDRRVRPAAEPGPLGFEEAAPIFTLEEALAEAKRCTASSPCLYCDVCQLMCPDLAIIRGGDGQIVIDLDYCKGCGLCAHYCPRGAIKMVVDE